MLAWIAAAMMTGLIAGGFLRSDASSVALVPLALGSLAFVVAGKIRARPRPSVLLLAALAAAAGGVGLVPARSSPGIEGVFSVDGTVGGCDAESGCVIDIDRMATLGAPMSDVHTRARIHGIAGRPGDAITLDAELRPHASFRNPSPHPDWPNADPIAWVGRARESTVVVRPAALWRRAVESVRTRVREGLAQTTSPPTRGLAIALVLGDEAEVDAGSAASVRSAGLTHVLAVSGMHVTIVVGAVLFALVHLLRRSWLAARIDTSRLAHGMAAPLVLVYAELAGGAPSAWRAAVTAALAWALRAAGRRPDAMATSALAVIVFASIDPASALRPAFVLSIAATAAVLDLPGELTLETLVRSSVRASILTAPLVTWCFDGVPIIAVAANVILLPIVAALVLPLATVHALVAALAPDLAGPTGAVLDWTCRGFVGACDALGAIDVGRSMPPLDAPEAVIATLTAITVVAIPGWRRKLVVLAIAAIALAGAEMRLRTVEIPHGALRVTFLDVGQGEAALIDLPDGSLMVVDTGGAFHGGADPGARVLVPLLRARRRTRVDRLVITHPHPDHYGGAMALAARFPIDEVWDSGQARDEDPDGTWSSMLRSFDRVLDPSSLCRARDVGGVRIEVLWPYPRFDPGWDANDNSLVLRVTYGARSILLAGDAEAHAESALLAAGLRGPIDVLKVGHHGSHTSSSEAFVSALEPRIAIVSAGVGNRFGHPHADVIERFAAHGTRVLRTDHDGGVIVRTDGRALHVETWSGEEITAGVRGEPGRRN